MRRTIVTLLMIIFLANVSLGNASSGFAELQIPDVQSETAVLVDADTGQVLFQKDKDKHMYPASITKIMTGMLAMKHGNLTDTITMSDEAVFSIERDSSNIALDVGEEITLEQALYALSVASANDAANGIAEYTGGTIDDFVDMMNSSAKAAGAVNTCFTNANGLPDNNQYTTAYDMALVTAEAISIPGFAEIFNTRRYEIPPTNKQPETRIFNSSNRFTNGEISYEGTLMSKAGWTVAAQHTLVTAAQRNGTTLIAVVMKSADSTVKWSDTTALLDFGFEQFNSYTIPKERLLQDASKDMTVPNNQDITISADTYSDITVLLPKGFSSGDIRFSIGDPAFVKNKSQVKLPICVRFASPDTTCIPEEYHTTIQATLSRVKEDRNAHPEKSTEQSLKSIFKMLLISFFVIIGALLFLFLFLVIRRALIIRKRKRRKTAHQRNER